jgi:hypothetical protein
LHYGNKNKIPIKVGRLLFLSFTFLLPFVQKPHLPSPIKCQIDPNGKRLIIGAIITMNEFLSKKITMNELDTEIER